MTKAKESTDYQMYPNAYEEPVVGKDGWLKGLAKFCGDHNLVMKRHRYTYEWVIHDNNDGSLYYVISQFPRDALEFWLHEVESRAHAEAAAIRRGASNLWLEYHEVIDKGDLHHDRHYG